MKLPLLQYVFYFMNGTKIYSFCSLVDCLAHLLGYIGDQSGSGYCCLHNRVYFVFLSKGSINYSNETVVAAAFFRRSL